MWYVTGKSTRSLAGTLLFTLSILSERRTGGPRKSTEYWKDDDTDPLPSLELPRPESPFFVF